MPQDKIKEVYDLISDLGYFADENEFRGYVSDPNRRKEAYELISDAGYFADENEFNSYFESEKKKFGVEDFNKKYGTSYTPQEFGGQKPSPSKSPSTSTPTSTTTTTPKVKPIEATQQPIKLQQRTPSGQPDFVPPQEVVKQLTERGQAPYDEVKERNRLQNGAQGIQKAQANAAKQLQQRDEILAQIEETKALLEQSKGNPNTYNQLVPQYNELVKQAQSVSDNFKSELQKIDIYEKGISATQLKIQMNEDSGDLRWQSGVNSFKQMALLALPTTARYAGYFGARSRGIPPDMAYKVAKDFSEQNFGGLIDSARELAAENEELQEVFSKESAWQAIKSGDIDKTADLATKELMGTLPVTLGLMLTYVNPYVGATSTIMGTAGMELEELEGEDMSPEGKMTNALVKGGLEYATERIFGTIPMVKRAIGAKSKAGQEVVENLLLQTWNKYAKKMGFSADVIEEVGSEMINTIGGNYTDYLTGKTDDLQLLKDIGQTFTTSLSMAALLSGGGRAMKYSSKKIDDLRGNTKKLQEIAERQETTPEVLEVIQENIVANNEKIGEESQKEKEVFDSMTEEEWDEATALIQENQSLQEQIEAGEVQPEILPVIEKKIEENTAIVEDIKKEVVATLDERQQARVSALENLKIADEETKPQPQENEEATITAQKENVEPLLEKPRNDRNEEQIGEASAELRTNQEGETQEVKPTESKEEVAPQEVSVEKPTNVINGFKFTATPSLTEKGGLKVTPIDKSNNAIIEQQMFIDGSTNALKDGVKNEGNGWFSAPTGVGSARVLYNPTTKIALEIDAKSTTLAISNFVENNSEEAQAEEAVIENKASEPSKSDKNYQEAQEANSIVSKENPDASVLIQPKGEDLSLTAIYVGKEKRGKGIGSKVLESVKKQANKLGKKVVLDATNELDEETALERLGNFYEKNGFKKVGENKYEYDPKAKDSSRDIGSRADDSRTKKSDIAADTNKKQPSEKVDSTEEAVSESKEQNLQTNKQQEDEKAKGLEGVYSKEKNDKKREGATKEVIDSTKKLLNTDLGYHGGNLQDKSDYLTIGYRGEQPFTGHYFFSDRERAEARGNRTQLKNNEVSVVDFSKYNLLKPTTNEYWAAKAGLKKFEDRLLRDGIDAAFDSLESRYGLKDSYPKLYEQIISNKGEIEQVVNDWKTNELDKINEKKQIERLETLILKALGYEGVDVRGLKESNGEASPDSGSEGSVIFDLKPNTILESPSKPKEASGGDSIIEGGQEQGLIKNDKQSNDILFEKPYTQDSKYEKILDTLEKYFKKDKSLFLIAYDKIVKPSRQTRKGFAYEFYDKGKIIELEKTLSEFYKSDFDKSIGGFLDFKELNEESGEKQEVTPAEVEVIKEINITENEAKRAKSASPKRTRKSKDITKAIESQAKDVEDSGDVEGARDIIQAVETATEAILTNQPVNETFEKKNGVSEIAIVKEMADMGKEGGFSIAYENLTGEKPTLKDEIDFLSSVSASGLKIKPKLLTEFTEEENVVISFPSPKKKSKKDKLDYLQSYANVKGINPATSGVYFDGDLMITIGDGVASMVVSKNPYSESEIKKRLVDAVYKRMKKLDAKFTMDKALQIVEEDLKGSIDKKVLNFGNSAGVINETFPRYEQVIPEISIEEDVIKVNAADFQSILNGAANILNNLQNGIFGINLVLNGKELFFSPSRLLEVVDYLVNNDAKELRLFHSGIGNKPLLIESDNGTTAIVMPLFMKEDAPRTQPFDFKAKDKIISFLENLKADTKNKSFDAVLGIPIGIWNATIDTITLSIKAGVSISDAIKRGLNYIQKNHRGAWDKKGFNQKVLEELGLRGIEVNGEDLIVKPVEKEFASVVNGFYSDIEQSLLDTNKNNLSGKDWISALGNSDEANWTGLTDWLSQQEGSVSKADIRKFLKDNRIEVVEVVKGEDGSDTWIKEGDSYFSKNREYEIRDLGEDGFELLRGKYNLGSVSSLDMAKENAIEDGYSNDKNINDNTKFSEYQLEGEKKNYKEVLVTLPNQGQSLIDDYNSMVRRRNDLEKEVGLDMPTKFQRDEHDKLGFKIEDLKSKLPSIVEIRGGGIAEVPTKFKSSHFEEPNILVHLRMNTRKDSEGNKVLFLEEVQSDWGQKGKKEGFTAKAFTDNDAKRIKELNQQFEKEGLYPEEMTELTNLRRLEKGISLTPSAPFVTDTNAWTKLGLKVALKEAVKQGADKIAWTTGEQQNERYDLSKQVDKIDVESVEDVDNLFFVDIKLSNGTTENLEVENGIIREGNYKGQRLDSVIGKDYADKIMSTPKGERKTLEGNDLKVGGKGMKGFYGSPTERAKAPKLTIEKVGDKFKVGSREFKTENEAKKYIDEYGLGIVGNVAKSLFKQEPKTTKIDIGNEYLSTWDNAKAQGFKVIEKSEYKNASSYTKDFVIVDKDGDAVASSDTKQMAIDVFLKTSNLAQVEQRKVSIQNSIDITPELKASVEGGLPLFGNVIQALERLKSNQGGKMNAFGILPAAWNAIIDTLILGVKAGKAINKLVQEAIEKLKNESSTFDEKAFKDMLIEGGVVTEEELVGEGTKVEGKQKKSGFQERSIEDSTNEVVKEIARENEVYYTEMNQKKEYEAAQKDFGTTEDVIQNFVDLKIGQTLTLDEAARVQVARQVAMQTLSIEISKQVAMGNDPVKLNDMVNQIQNALAKDFAKGGQIGAMAVWKFMTPTGIVYQVQQKIKEANAAAELKLNAEQKAELAEMEAKIADLQAKLDEEIAKTAERKANKPKKQKEFSQEKKDRKAELKEILRKKMFGQLNDISNIARIIFEKETIEYAKLVIEEGAIDFNSFAKEMSSDFGKAIRPYLPSLYEKVSGEGVIDAESRKQMEEYLQKNFSKAYGTSRIPTNRKPKKDLDRILEGVNQGVLNDDFYKSLFLEKFGMKANLTASEVAELQRLAAAVTSLPPTSKLYNIAVLNMAQFIDSKYPRSFFSDLIDTWVALFYANMLSGVSTHVLNIVSTGSGIMNSPFRNAVNLSKWVRSIKMGIKDKSLSSLIAYNPIYESYFIPPMHIEGVKIGTDLFMDTLTEGATNDKYIEGLVNQTSKITIPTLEQNRYGKGMRYRPIRIGKYDINPYNKAKYVGRSLAAEDALMNWSAYEMELTQLATEIFREKGYRGKKLRDAVVEAFTNKSVDMAEIDRKLQSEIDTFNLSGKQLSERAKRIRRSELVVEAGLNAMNATLEQRQQTKDLAASATFTDDRNGVISRVAQLLSMAANYNRFTQVTIKPWIPFTKVVANVTEFAFDTLPIYGLMRANGMGVTGLISKVAKDTRNKEFKSSQMGEVGTQAYYEQMSRAWQGTIAFSAALMVFGVSGDDDDYEDNYVQLTGSYNEELKKGIRGREDVIPPYSIKIGNFLMSYKSIPVVNVSLACIGNYNDYMNMKRYSKEELDERMTLALKYSAVESITMVKDMSFIEGMKDLLEIISIATDVSKWDKVGKKVLEKYAGFVGKPLPQNNAMVNQVSKFFDPVSYSRKEVQDILAYSAGLQRMYGTPNRDIFGETVKSYPSEGTIPYTHWFNLNVADADIRFLSRYNAIPDGLQNKKSKIFNTELGVYELRKMEPVEFDKYVELSGKLFREKLHNYQQTTNADERANKQEEYGGNSYNGVAFDVNKLQNEAAEEAKAKLFLAKSLEVDELKRISAIKALDRLSKVESDSTSDANKELLMQEGGITENELRIKKNVEDNKKNASVYMIEEIRKQGIIEPLDQEMFLLRMRDLGIISKDNYNESLKILGILPIE